MAARNLERVHVGGVRRDRNHGDDSSSEPLRREVGAVVADDHGGSTFVGLGSPDGIEIDEADLASAHQVSPSDAVGSQTSPSPVCAHSVHASSYAAPSSEARNRRTARCNAADRDGRPWVLA